MRATDIICVPLLAIASALRVGCKRDADKPAETGTKTSAAGDSKSGTTKSDDTKRPSPDASPAPGGR